MSKAEILVTPYGEMRDMMNCLAIYNGGVEPKEYKKTMTYDEVMALR